MKKIDTKDFIVSIDVDDFEGDLTRVIENVATIRTKHNIDPKYKRLELGIEADDNYPNIYLYGWREETDEEQKTRLIREAQHEEWMRQRELEKEAEERKLYKKLKKKYDKKGI